jgi:fluoroquinolone resistance protein
VLRERIDITNKAWTNFSAMDQELAEGKTFNNIDFTNNPLPKGEYEACVFKSCDFSNSDLSEVIFMECEFGNCNLSMAKLNNTAFRDIRFKSCKMLGLHFENCIKTGFSVSFYDCNLSHSSFYQVKLIKTTFINLKLHDVDFTESDLNGSVFENCDLTRAVFEKTNIEKADFRTAFNYSIDPQTNRIRKARFSINGIAGLLDRYNIEIDF